MITACQQDAYATEGLSQVLRVARAEVGFHAWLSDSILYAEGGGQPSDQGTIEGVPVWSVTATPEGLRHHLAAEIPTGEVRVRVDWARRFDHMQHHTGQHLFTAIARVRFGWQTTSFHLHPGQDALCDIEVDAEPWSAALAELQQEVNAAIRAALPVTTRLVDALTGDVRSRGLPEGHQGPIRLVEISGIDLNACGGTHVRSTAELQALALLGTERIRGGTRLFFVVGGRLLSRLQVAEQRADRAAALLSRGPADLVEGVQRLLDDTKAASKARQAAVDALADALGAELASRSGPRALHRDQGDPAFLNRIASAVAKVEPEAVIFLTAGSGPEGAFLLAGPPAKVTELRPEVLERLGAKGGGPPGRLQGQATRLDRRGEILALLGR